MITIMTTIMSCTVDKVSVQKRIYQKCRFAEPLSITICTKTSVILTSEIHYPLLISLTNTLKIHVFTCLLTLTRKHLVTAPNTKADSDQGTRGWWLSSTTLKYNCLV